MPLTAIALCLYLGLLLLNFVLAGISYHVDSLRPIWAFAQALNKLSSLLVVPAIVIDLIMFFF